MGAVGLPTILLADADVLIDFVKTRPDVLKLVSRHVGELRVLSEVLATVDGLTKKACTSYAIEVVSVSTELLLEAGAKQQGALSFEDRLGLLACQKHGWTMVTNDGSLIRACSRSGVSVRRGLRLILDLVAVGRISKLRASQLASAIHEVNPSHIHAEILRRFESELAKI